MTFSSISSFGISVLTLSTQRREATGLETCARMEYDAMSPFQGFYEAFDFERAMPFLKIYCPFRAKLGVVQNVRVENLSMAVNPFVKDAY